MSPQGDGWRVRVGDLALNLAATLVGDTLALQRDGLTVRFTVALEQHATQGERLWLCWPGRHVGLAPARPLAARTQGRGGCR